MQLDISRYRHHVENFDMTEAEKVQFLHDLWQFCGRIVDMVYGLDPTQLAMGLPPEIDSTTRGFEIEFKNILPDIFKKAAHKNKAGKDIS